MTTGKFKFQALGFGGGFSKGGAEQSVNLDLEVHDNGYLKLDLTHTSKEVYKEETLGPVGGEETIFKGDKLTISTQGGIEDTPKDETYQKEGNLIWGPYRENDEERKIVIDAEVSTPIIGIGVGAEVGVYKKDKEKEY